MSVMGLTKEPETVESARSAVVQIAADVRERIAEAQAHALLAEVRALRALQSEVSRISCERLRDSKKRSAFKSRLRDALALCDEAQQMMVAP